MTKEMMNKMVAEVRAEVEAMKVVEMRKEASKRGIKKPSQYKRPELVEKLVENIVAEKKQAIEAEEKAKKAAAKKANAGNKRYKANKIDNSEVDFLAEQIVNATPDEFDKIDLYHVNRKVLIGVMKRLHCELWYRTYDKPTMVQKITTAKVATVV